MVMEALYLMVDPKVKQALTVTPALQTAITWIADYIDRRASKGSLAEQLAVKGTAFRSGQPNRSYIVSLALTHWADEIKKKVPTPWAQLRTYMIQYTTLTYVDSSDPGVQNTQLSLDDEIAEHFDTIHAYLKSYKPELALIASRRHADTPNRKLIVVLALYKYAVEVCHFKP